jgi:hypothetical protein
MGAAVVALVTVSLCALMVNSMTTQTYLHIHPFCYCFLECEMMSPLRDSISSIDLVRVKAVEYVSAVALKHGQQTYF